MLDLDVLIETVKPYFEFCKERSGSCELTDCITCKATQLANKLTENGWRLEKESCWEYNKYLESHTCSSCQAPLALIVLGSQYTYSEYCPNCGAKMKKIMGGQFDD